MLNVVGSGSSMTWNHIKKKKICLSCDLVLTQEVSLNLRMLRIQCRSVLVPDVKKISLILKQDQPSFYHDINAIFLCWYRI